MFDSEVKSLIQSGALFVANHSGGKDSQAMLITLSGLIPKEQLIVIHASLGDVEWSGALELAQEHALKLCVPFLVARATKSFFDMVNHRFENRPEVPCWPSASTRQCTSDLKRGPIQREVRRFAKTHGFKTIVNCLGLRAQESSGRAKRDAFRKNESISNSVLTWYEWLPIHLLKTEQVFEVIRSAGQRPHYAYEQGNDRLSCMFCIMGSKADLANAAKHNPALFERYLDAEARTGYTMHMSRIPLAEMVAQAGTGVEQKTTRTRRVHSSAV